MERGRLKEYISPSLAAKKAQHGKGSQGRVRAACGGFQPLTALFRLCYKTSGDGNKYILRASGHGAEPRYYFGPNCPEVGSSLFRHGLFLVRRGDFFLLGFVLVKQFHNGIFHFTRRFFLAEILGKFLTG